MICDWAVGRVVPILRLCIKIGDFGLFVEDIDRHPNMHRCRASRGCDPKRPPQKEGDIFHAREVEGFLADARIQRRLVKARQAVLLVLIHRNVRAEEDHRNRRQIRFGNAGRAMGDAGTGRFKNGGPARDLGISLGREGRGAFITRQNEFDR